MNKQEFYNSLTQSVVPCEELFKKIYGYSYCDPDFLQMVAVRLVELGRKDIIQQYNEWLVRWNAQHEANMKSVAQWYMKQIENDSETKRRKEERKTWNRKMTIQSLTGRELTELCQRLLLSGIITSPEQFVTVVNRDR